MSGLGDLFQRSCPCIVGFITRLVATAAGAPQPKFPTILGTGFVVDSNGLAVTNRHVIECLESIKNNPRTGDPSVAAMLWFPGEVDAEHHGWQMVAVPILEWATLQTFGCTDEWYGTDVPDIAVVQLGIRDIPSLRFAEGDYYVNIGMEVSTLGYPLGEVPLTVSGRLNQMTP